MKGNLFYVRHHNNFKIITVLFPGIDKEITAPFLLTLINFTSSYYCKLTGHLTKEEVKKIIPYLLLKFLKNNFIEFLFNMDYKLIY